MRDWTLTFLDVGQGDATHILLPDGSSIFIDTGPDVSASSPVVWWAKGYGHGSIRSIVITHNHIDHFGGLLSLSGDKAIQIGEVYLNRDQVFDDRSSHLDFWELYASLKKREARGETKIYMARAGTVVYSDGNLELRVLHPQGISHPCPDDPNVTSMVLALYRVGAPSRPIIAWGGDAHLADVIAALGGVRPNLLMGPHHGSPQDLRSANVYKTLLASSCPGCVFASLGGKYKSQPKRQYVMAVSAQKSAWCCSQVSEQCQVVKNGRPQQADVYKGSALLGVRYPSGVFECRGSMRVFVDANGVLHTDMHQGRFLQRVRALVPRRHCN